MPPVRRTLLPALVVLSLLAPAAPAGEALVDAAIGLGDSFSGFLSTTGDEDVLVFDGLAGQLLDVKVKRGKNGALAAAALSTAEGVPVDTSAHEKVTGKVFRIGKFPLPASGGYRLSFTSADGSTGPYLVTTSGKVPKALRKLAASAGGLPGALDPVPFEALPGSRLSAKVAPAKGSAAVPAITGVQTPGGTLDVSRLVTSKGKAGTTLLLGELLLEHLGPHALLLQNDGLAAGDLSVKLKLKLPKAAKAKHAEPEIGPGDPGTLAGVLAVQPVPVLLEQEPNDGPDDAQFVGLMAPGKLVRIVGVTSDQTVPGSPDLADPFDAFRVRIEHDQTLFLTLLHDGQTVPGSQPPLLANADFDVYVFAPPVDLLEQPLASFATGDEPETGALVITDVVAPFDLDVVVTSWFGTGNYVLTLSSGGVAGEAAGGEAIAVGGWPGVRPPAAYVASPGAGTREGARPFPGSSSADDRHAAAGAPAKGVVAGLGAEAGAAAAPGALAAPAPAPPFFVLPPQAARLGRPPGLAVPGLLPRVAGARSKAYGERPVPFHELRVLVKLRDASRDPYAWAASHGLSVLSVSPSGWFVAEAGHLDGVGDAGFRRHATRELRDRLRRDPAVLRLDLDHVQQHFADPSPNDPFLGLQWHYALMNVTSAWSITTGNPDVIVAVLDTGIVAHPDLVARDTGTGYDMISSPSVARDGNGVDPDPTDVGDQANPDGSSSWHGTHVAGTIGAATHNAKGVAGVDQAAGLMHVRVLGKGGGSSFDVAEGVRYAAGLANLSGVLPPEAAGVVNMSFGSPADNAALADAIAAARAAGVTLVAAAGNANTDVPYFPASNEGVISVGAIDLAKNRAPYSNFGPTLDLCAPGGDTTQDSNGDGYPDGVLSTLFDEKSGAFAYGFYQGTSMAAPHVTGVVALMRALSPSLTPALVEMILQATAEDLGPPLADPQFGAGMVDALQALLFVSGGAGDEPLLAVSSGMLAFGNQQEELPLTIGNVGALGSRLDFSATATETTGTGWLSLTGTDGSVDGTAPATLLVSVDRSGLSPGAYAGTVAISSNGGSAEVAVTMEVAGASNDVLDLGPVFVLVVDPQTFATVAQTTATAGAPDWFATDVPPGNWLLAAGPDLDNDGFICGLGEPCGLYPVLSAPVLVPLGSGPGVIGLDFAVTDAGSLPASAGGQGLFALPPEGLAVTRP